MQIKLNNKIKMNKGKVEVHESMEEDAIPDEFSDDDVIDDIGYEEVDEKFEPKESVASSRGAARYAQRFTKTNERDNPVRRQEQEYAHGEYSEMREAMESPGQGEQSESVITEVVENKVVYLDSDKEESSGRGSAKYIKQGSNERDKQIQEYLDIDKNEYVNKDEYQDQPQDEEEGLTEEQQREIDILEQRKKELIREKDELEEIISDLDAQLDQSSPVLDNARQSLNTLDLKDITELRSLKNPPLKVLQTTNAIMLILYREQTWKSFQKAVANPRNFISLLINYDLDNMPDEKIDELDDYIAKNGLTEIESIKTTSYSASNLASFIVNLKNYARIRQTLRPLFDRKKEAEEILTQKIVEIQKIEQSQQEIIHGKAIQDEDSEIRHAGLQTSFNGKKHIVHYEVEDGEGGNRLVTAEIDADEDSPVLDFENQYGNLDKHKNNELSANNESLYYISNEIKKKDQSRKFVLWETNEMRNNWDDKLLSQSKKEAALKSNSHYWTHEPNEKSVSVIDSRKHKGKPKDMPKVINLVDEFANVPKKDHYIHNVFLQSNLQDRLEDHKEKKKAPWSHNSYNKTEKEKNYMVEGRPLFEGKGNHVQNINSGRARIFYSSNVF